MTCVSSGRFLRKHFFLSVASQPPQSFCKKVSNIFCGSVRRCRRHPGQNCCEAATRHGQRGFLSQKSAILIVNAIGPLVKTHTHHLVPRSRGGTDDPKNLVILDFVEHARLHAEDFLAGGPDFDFRHEGWKLLDEDLQLRVRQEKSRRLQGNGGNFGGGTHTWLGRTGMRWWHDGLVAVRAEECPGPGWVEGQLPSTNKKKGRPGVPKSDEWREKMRRKRQGDRNPCAGRRWVTDGETNIYLKPGEETPENFKPGRTL